MSEEIIGLIGGSGLGDKIEKDMSNEKMVKIQTPFGNCSGPIMTGKVGNKKIAFINRHGRGHTIAPSDVPYAANIFALKSIGVHTIIATAAVGSLREEISPKDLILVDQFIDKTYKRQSSFFHGVAAVHCEMAQPVCRRLRQKLFDAAGKIGVKTHEKGTYVCMEGPQFSTRAESLMHRQWGGDLIGMTAMPEAKLAREAQMCYALIALASDYDCWREHEANKDKQTLLKEIIGNLNEATQNAISLIEAALSIDGDINEEKCHCRGSLELAMWTANDRISKKDKEKLAVLFE
ncbi:MAG TPA: S-methyl-5'-thioadenosine phosphorylase [Sedimentisphaerales bacterium]|nr:S-methyl-5'-thioadenosine phosphorylase [Sedimentisphaerales bacterium]